MAEPAQSPVAPSARPAQNGPSPIADSTHSLCSHGIFEYLSRPLSAFHLLVCERQTWLYFQHALELWNGGLVLSIVHREKRVVKQIRHFDSVLDPLLLLS
jgi:hypothetical protein